MAKNMAVAREAHDESLVTYFQFLAPEYEKNCLTEYL